MTEGRPKPNDAELDDYFRLMVENSGDILTIRGADGRIRYTNPSVYRILGYKQEEMIGATGFELLHPEDRSAVERAFAEFWKTPGARDSIQYRARHANGSWVSLEVVAHNLLDDPKIRGVILSDRDVSKRQEEDSEKNQLIDDLQRALAQARVLKGVLPICSSCKKIRNERGEWQQIEIYLRERTSVEFSHGMCPECAHLWFPDQFEEAT